MTSTLRVTRSGWGRGTTIERLARSPANTRGDVQHVLGLEPEVELLDDGLGEQLDQGRRVGQGGHRDPAHQLRGDPRHGGDVQPHQAGHGAALHLDHDPLAGPQGGRVDLGDGGRGDGYAVEGREHLGQRSAQVLLDRATHGGERLGRHPVPQQLELPHQLLGEDALARRDDLAQLDVGRAQPLEGRTQPPRQAGARVRSATVAQAPAQPAPTPAGSPTVTTRSPGRQPAWANEPAGQRGRVAGGARRCHRRRPGRSASAWPPGPRSRVQPA